jgi:hypothetical protein
MGSFVKKMRRKMREAQKVLGGQIVFDEYNIQPDELMGYFEMKIKEATEQGDKLTVEKIRAAFNLLTHGKR